MDTGSIAQFFRKNGFKATPQRIAVYKYLVENPCHPDADEIYKNVLADNPSFSKTTVYNALQALSEHGFIQNVKIDSRKTRYDADTGLHGHFLCKRCERIFDFSISKMDIETDGLDGFEITGKDVYYSGICPECK